MKTELFNIDDVDYDFDKSEALFNIVHNGLEYFICFTVTPDEFYLSGVGNNYTVHHYVEDQNGEAQLITLEKSLHELLGNTWFFGFNSALENWFYNCYEKEYNDSDYHNGYF